MRITRVLESLHPLRPVRTVSAHCDLPCGIYEPDQARIEAESCYNAIKKYADSDDAQFKARAIHIKEERAELCKHHLSVLWSDYFKPNHLEEHPELHDLFWRTIKQAGEVKKSLDLATAETLLDLIDEIDAIFKATGGWEANRLRKPVSA